MYYLKYYMNCILNRIKPIAYEAKMKLRENNYNKEILYSQAGNDLIGSLIDRKLPLMVSRLGGVELQCISFYIQERLKKKKRYPHRIRHLMSNNAGFFPAADDLLDEFCEQYLRNIKDADIMAVWFNDYEDVICNTYCKNASLIELGCLESFMFSNPWTSRLQGKEVLVIHPFAEAIKKQYFEKRQVLFNDRTVLPEFELKTIKAVQSIANAKVDFKTWFDAYNYMCDEIAKSEFDISIIGAGAYGLPLSSFVKRLGKQAIHMGGVTQILFGIKGKRWETEYADTIGKIFNEHWIRPLETETPRGHQKVDKGCYW